MQAAPGAKLRARYQAKRILGKSFPGTFRTTVRKIVFQSNSFQKTCIGIMCRDPDTPLDNFLVVFFEI